MSRHNHTFLICEKKIANIGGTDYDYYEVINDGSTYYMMEHGWPKPDGYTVHRVRLLASSGSNYMLHHFTKNDTHAEVARGSDQYAGGGQSKYYHVALTQAHMTMVMMSGNQVGAHSGFPLQAVSKLIVPCRWKVAGEWVDGTYGDWITAGTPADNFIANPVISEFIG